VFPQVYYPPSMFAPDYWPGAPLGAPSPSGRGKAVGGRKYAVYQAIAEMQRQESLREDAQRELQLAIANRRALAELMYRSELRYQQIMAERNAMYATILSEV